jgi:hypothetical protein
MTRSTLLKFRLITLSNVKSLVLINLLLIVPALLFLYTLVKIVPVVLRYIDTMNVSVLRTSPEYKRLAVVVFSPSVDRASVRDNVRRGTGIRWIGRSAVDRTSRDTSREMVYIFERVIFREVRKDIFQGNHEKLEDRSLGFSEVPLSSDSLVVRDKEGKQVMTLKIESVREGTVEVLFYRDTARISYQWVIIYSALLFFSWVAISGTLGGINDFTQRIIFHETKRLGYLFSAIKRHFARSLSVSLFFCVVMGAVAANIYFYIFIVASDISVFIAAINAWMFLFFLLVLFWVYPLLVLNSEESMWKVMKKSLFVSFDNFVYTLRSLGVLLIMIAASCLTLFVFPGISFCFGFVNTALKEISSRYSKLDVA